MVLSFASLVDENLAAWIDACTRFTLKFVEKIFPIHCSYVFSFPATMVDRITPIVADNHREILEKDFGILDEWPVVTEVFHQWVIEVCK
jgi:mannitol-1-phosphate/altronate dehydrogenase